MGDVGSMKWTPHNCEVSGCRVHQVGFFPAGFDTVDGEIDGHLVSPVKGQKYIAVSECMHCGKRQHHFIEW